MKKFKMILVVGLCVLAITGCSLMDSLFFKADEVMASDLSDFTGTVPTTKDAASDAVLMPVMMSFATAGESFESSESFQNALPKGLTSILPESKLLNFFLSDVASKSIEMTVVDEEFEQSISVEIEDEEVTDGGTGTALINGTLSGEVKVDLNDAETEAVLTGKGEVDTNVVFTNYSDPNDTYTIVKGVVNLIVKANGTIKTTESTGLESVEYYAAIDLKAGFSISGGDGASGKFIIEFNFVSDGEYTQSDLEDPETLADDVDVSVALFVFDNDDVLQAEYHYTYEDFEEYINDFI